MHFLKPYPQCNYFEKSRFPGKGRFSRVKNYVHLVLLCLQAFEGLLVSLKSTKDTGTFQAGSKSIATDHKNETAAISELGNLLKQLSPETAEKVAELQKQDR